MANTVPHDTAAEKATLGSVLIDPAVLLNLDFLTPEHFFLQKHRWVFEAIRDLSGKREAIDFLTVSSALEAMKRLNGIGGDAYLIELMNEVPSAISVDTYARRVYKLSVRRSLLNAASEIARLAYDESRDLEDIVGEAESSVFRVRAGAIEERTYDSLRLTQLVYESLERAETRQRMPVISTGYPEIDDILGGFYRQGLYLIAARTGIGKTALKLNMAQSMVKRGLNVAFFSLEMSAEAIAERMLVSAGSVSLRELRSGKVHDESWPALSESMGKLSKLPIWVDDTQALSVSQLRSKAMRLEMEHGLDAVFVDYIQLMRADERTEKRYEEIGRITRGLKSLAKELDVAVIAGSQLSRAAEGRHPTLEHLRESGDQEQDSDGVIFIYREREVKGDRMHAEAIVAKHRHGATGIADLEWIPHRAAFVSVVAPYGAPPF